MQKYLVKSEVKCQSFEWRDVKILKEAVSIVQNFGNVEDFRRMTFFRHASTDADVIVCADHCRLVHAQIEPRILEEKRIFISFYYKLKTNFSQLMQKLQLFVILKQPVTLSVTVFYILTKLSNYLFIFTS